MKKRLLSVILACLLLAGCASRPAPADLPGESAPPAEQTEGTVDADQLEQLISHTAIFFPERSQAYIRGKVYTLSPAPFLEDGVLYIPAAPVAAAFGGSFVEADGFCYMNYMGNVSVMMEQYNVLLYNTDSIIMDRTPVVKEGVLCLPFAGLGKALSAQTDKSLSQKIYILGGSATEEQFAALRQQLLGTALPYAPAEGIQTMARSCGLEVSRLETAAKQKALWVSDDRGVISRLWLDDEGGLQRQSYEMSCSFAAEQVYIGQGNTLLCLTGGEDLDTAPDILYQQQLRQATGRYMELLAAQCIYDDPEAARLLAAYRNAVEGDLTDPEYIRDLQTPYTTRVYDDGTGEAAWEKLVAAARPGDFLVFSAQGAGPKYGFFNHSALILETDAPNGCLRLLHARGSEYGVGADLDMDYLSFQSFDSVDYYRNYDRVFLCRAGALTPAAGEEMAWAAYEKFNNYQFGYGGRLGLEETNCAELITDAYSAAGVTILEGDQSSRLKEVLKGNTKNLVPIPDDLLLSGNVQVMAVWKR